MRNLNLQKLNFDKKLCLWELDFGKEILLAREARL